MTRSTVQHLLDSARRRALVHSVLVRAGWGAAIGGAAALVVLLLARSIPLDLSLPALAVPALVGLLGGAVLGALLAPSPDAVAALIDRRLDLADRVSTVVAMEHAAVRADPEFAALVRRESEARAAGLRASDAITLGPGAGWLWALGGALLLAIGATWLPMRVVVDESIEAPEVAAARQSILDELAQATTALAAARAEAPSRSLAAGAATSVANELVEERLRELDRLAERLADPIASSQDLPALREQAAAALERLADDAEREAIAAEQAADAAAGEFAALARREAPPRATALAEALREARFGEAVDALRQLESDATQLDDAERAALASYFRDLAARHEDAAQTAPQPGASAPDLAEPLDAASDAASDAAKGDERTPIPPEVITSEPSTSEPASTESSSEAERSPRERGAPADPSSESRPSGSRPASESPPSERPRAEEGTGDASQRNPRRQPDTQSGAAPEAEFEASQRPSSEDPSDPGSPGHEPPASTSRTAEALRELADRLERGSPPQNSQAPQHPRNPQDPQNADPRSESRQPEPEPASDAPGARPEGSPPADPGDPPAQPPTQPRDPSDQQSQQSQQGQQAPQREQGQSGQQGQQGQQSQSQQTPSQETSRQASSQGTASEQNPPQQAREAQSQPGDAPTDRDTGSAPGDAGTPQSAASQDPAAPGELTQGTRTTRTPGTTGTPDTPDTPSFKELLEDAQQARDSAASQREMARELRERAEDVGGQTTAAEREQRQRWSAAAAREQGDRDRSPDGSPNVSQDTLNDDSRPREGPRQDAPRNAPPDAAPPSSPQGDGEQDGAQTQDDQHATGARDQGTERGASPSPPPDGMQRGNGASRAGAAPGEPGVAPSRPGRFDGTEDLDLRDRRGGSARGETIAEWFDDGPIAEGSPEGTAPRVARRVMDAQRTAERAIEHSSLPSRYHPLLRRYFGRFERAVDRAGSAEPSGSSSAAAPAGPAPP